MPTISELIEAKQKLTEDVIKLIAAFESEFNVCISNIDITRTTYYIYDGKSHNNIIHLDININV